MMDAKKVSERPVFIDTFLVSSHLIFGSIGMPLNLVIIALILARRRLHQPRNIIWIGISFSNVLILTAHLLEVVSFYSTDTTELCRFRYFLVGLPYVSLLMNHFFSLVDRYLSVSRLIWYQRCVTKRWIIGLQLAVFILLFFLMKPHYIFGVVQVDCKFIPPLDGKIFFAFILTFLLLCLAGQLLLYFRVKGYLVSSTNRRQNTNGGMDTTNNVERAAQENTIQQAPGNNEHIVAQENTTNRQPQNYEDVVVSPEGAVSAFQMEANSTISKWNSRHFVQIRDQLVSQLELEATRNVIFGVTSLLFFTAPWVISSVLGMVCYKNVQQQGLTEEETAMALFEQCSRYRWASSYSRELLVAHSIYQSIFYMTRSKDFSAALRPE